MAAVPSHPGYDSPERTFLEDIDVDYVAENAAARERVLALVRGLPDDQFLRPVGRDWTVGATLAHLAFWERVHGGRLRAAMVAGVGAPPPLPDGLTDIINDGELPTWLRLPGRAALQVFETASADIDAFLRTLDPVMAASVRAAGMPNLVERFRHRRLHGDALAEALRAGGS